MTVMWLTKTYILEWVGEVKGWVPSCLRFFIGIGGGFSAFPGTSPFMIVGIINGWSSKVKGQRSGISIIIIKNHVECVSWLIMWQSSGF